MSGSPSNREVIENWASEFPDSFVFTTLPEEAKAHAVEVCVSFHAAACEAGGSGPGEVAWDGAWTGLDRLASLDLPFPARQTMPETVAVYLEWLESCGRLSGGANLAAEVRAIGPEFRNRLRPEGGEKGVPATASPQTGRNDPCPCGSGKKYKKCCMR